MLSGVWNSCRTTVPVQVSVFAILFQIFNDLAQHEVLQCPSSLLFAVYDFGGGFGTSILLLFL